MLKDEIPDPKLGAPDEFPSKRRHLSFGGHSKAGAGIRGKAPPRGRRQLRGGSQPLDSGQKALVDETIAGLEPPEGTQGKDEGIGQFPVV